MELFYLICLLLAMYACVLFFILPRLGGVQQQILREKLYSLIDKGDDEGITKMIVRHPKLVQAEYAATLPLIEAVRQGEGDLSIVLTLLAHGADPNAAAQKGIRTAVHQAIFNDDDRYLEILLANEGDAKSLLKLASFWDMESKVNLLRQYVSPEDWSEND